MKPYLKYVVLTLALPLGWAAAQEAPAPDAAFVRVAHLSPNAPEVSINLTSTAEGGQTLAPDELSGLSYRDTTDYLEVPSGEYDVVLETPEGNLTETLSFNASAYYTVAAIGLVIPENLGEQADVQDEEGGFFSFLGNIFSDGANQDSLALRLASYDDDPPLSALEAQPAAVGVGADPAATAPAATPPATVGEPVGGAVPVPQFARVRLVHAAPGTAPISLVNVAGAAQEDGEARTVVSDLAFADASSYNDLEPAEASGLEVRIEGSAAAILTLEEVSFRPNEVYTLFVIGTPVEEAPLETLLLGGEAQTGGGSGTETGGAGSGGGN